MTKVIDMDALYKEAQRKVYMDMTPADRKELKAIFKNPGIINLPHREQSLREMAEWDAEIEAAKKPN